MEDNASQLEVEYQKLISKRGPFGSEKARRAAFRYWTDRGEAAAAWLARRSLDEQRVVALMEIAHVLAQIGQDSVKPILHVLLDGCSPEHADAMFAALRRIQVDPVYVPRIMQLCRVYKEEWVANDGTVDEDEE